MPPELNKYLYDMMVAAEAIEGFLEGKSFDDYESSDVLRSAVERKLMIIGEAVSQALSKHPDLERNISNARKIVDFRNILVHGYFAIENQTVWGILQKDLPLLKQQIRNCLGR